MPTPAPPRVFLPPEDAALPLLVDSPHSGREYPPDFAHACALAQLQRYEDRYVDLLVAGAPDHGATLITADVPRTYIDVNRAADDIAPAQLSGPWKGPAPLRPSANCTRGTGLIWATVWDTPIYAAPLAPDDVAARIETYYHPYYDAMDAASGALYRRFGAVWHLNVHSMPPATNGGKSDIVLGDLDGRSCDPDFTRVVRAAFEAHGLRVTMNEPYKGAQLVTTYGRPHENRHSLQVELNKALYLKPDLIDVHDRNFMKLRDTLEDVIAVAAQFAADQLAAKTDANVSRKAASSTGMGTDLPSAANDVTP